MRGMTKRSVLVQRRGELCGCMRGMPIGDAVRGWVGKAYVSSRVRRELEYVLGSVGAAGWA